MSLKKFLPSVLVTGMLLAASAAQAITVVTLNPQANNGLGAAGVIDATEPAFQATGFLGSLGSVLQINADMTFLETGRIAVSDFQLGNANVNTNVASNYNIFADFTLSGVGMWTGNQFTGQQFGATLTFTLGADTNSDGIVDFTLGTGSLDNALPAIAFAILFPGLVQPGNTNSSALTSFTATIDFTPAAGTTGVNGFFQAPTPFSIDISAGNVGGNLLDTTFTGTPGGAATITTVGGSGNFDFVQAGTVPEPGALALVGLALAGAAVATRRKQRAQA